MASLSPAALLSEPADLLLRRLLDLGLTPSGDSVEPLFNRPSWAAATECVSAFEPVVHAYLGTCARIAPSVSREASNVLHIALAEVCTSWWVGTSGSLSADLAVGLCSHLRIWADQLQTCGRVHWGVAVLGLSPTEAPRRPTIDPTAANYVALASISQLMKETREGSYVAKVERIASLLALSPSELARLLDVSREGLRRWLAGAPISTDRWEKIDALSDTVEQMIQYVKLDRLPSVVRRESEALDGSSPLNWLVAGRYRDLLNTYKRALSYQVPL